MSLLPALDLLVLDEGRPALESLCAELAAGGCLVERAASRRELLETLSSGAHLAALVELTCGFELRDPLLELRNRLPGLELVALVPLDPEPAALAACDWATDQLPLAWVPQALPGLLGRLGVRDRQQRRLQALGELMRSQGSGGLVVGRSVPMARIHRTAMKVASSPRTTILIEGEPGTGKELLARAIHARSPRAGQPFVTVDCSAHPPEELNLLLLGHEAGVVPEVIGRRPGLLELADGGSLCLIEVGFLPVLAQARLLRVIESGTTRRIGAGQDLPVDVRLIATSSRSLRAEVALRRFRDDLFFQLQVVPIVLPPLRQRPEDIPYLASGFAAARARLLGRPAPDLTPEAIAVLARHDWPGNIAELRSAVERAVARAEPGRPLTAADLASAAGRPEAPAGAAAGPDPGGNGELPEGTSLQQALDAYARGLIAQAIEAAGGNKSEAARKLGIPRHVLRYQSRRLGVKGT